MKATKQVYTFRLSKEAIQVIEQQPGKNRTSQLEHLIFFHEQTSPLPPYTREQFSERGG